MLLTLIAILMVAALLFVRRQYSYWETVGIPSLKGTIPFGNLKPVAMKEKSFGVAVYDLYKQTTEPFVGIYLFFRPALIIRDAELIKNILTRDFQYFHDRGTYCDQKNDPMSAHLFALPGEAWKSLRTKLTPAFTSGKLKGMFPTVNAVGDELVELMKPLAEKGETIEIREFTSRYVVDCIASIAFGQEGISSLKNPDHEFRAHSTKINSDKSIVNIIRGTSTFLCPNLIKILRLKGLPRYMRDFCLNLVTKTVDEREANNIVKKDLMQYLIQLRNKNESSTDADEWKINASGKSVKSMSYEEIAAQVFIFYVAGNETSSSTVYFTLYELTQNEGLMEKAQKEIKSTLEKYNGELNYEAIMEMKFIDFCIKETLRKYPFPMLNRECTKDYEVPGTKFTIQKGTPIIVSLLGTHRDERFFPNANKYDPERFSDERKDYNEDMYMPFGAGPRNCIAFRMGLLVAKVAIAHLLRNFRFEAVSKRELEFDYGSIALAPKEGQCVIKIMNK